MEIDRRLKFAAMYPLKRAIFPLKGQTEKKKSLHAIHNFLRHKKKKLKKKRSELQ